MLAALAVAAAVSTVPPPPGIGPTPKTWLVRFEPLTARERWYAGNGPAGPYYPDKAARAGVTGAVLMTCTAAAEGVLKRCRVIAEDPDGYDFGVAALRLADLKRIRLIHLEEPGTPVRVRVPFEPAP